MKAQVDSETNKDLGSGRVFRAPRFTAWALVYFLVFFAAPLLGLLAAADYALYRLFSDVLGRCYGLGCLWS